MHHDIGLIEQRKSLAATIVTRLSHPRAHGVFTRTSGTLRNLCAGSVSNLTAEVGCMTRRSIVAAVSIFVHAIIVFFAMTADLWRPINEWPTPRRALAFVDDALPVHVDIELPRPQRARATTSAPTAEPPATTTQSIELAPVRPPSGIGRETGHEAQATGARALAEVESGGAGLSEIGTAVAPPPPPPKAQEPIRLGGGIQAPQRVANVTPVYPAAARLARVEGL
jgi:hypothetical protein